MSGNVVRVLQRGTDPDVIARIEDVLEAAKAGEIHGVMILSQDAGGVRYTLAGIKDRFSVLGWLSHAMHRLQTDD